MVEDCKDCDKQEFDNSFEDTKPYETLYQTNNHSIRIFPAHTEYHLLKWHSDETDRIVTPLFDTDWKFQFDDELPQRLTKDTDLYIKEGRIHRLIKGKNSLVVRISIV